MDPARWERRLQRERARTAELERIIEDKTRELYLANEKLREQNEGLEAEVEARTVELRAALQAAEAANAAKTEFLAQMSHELRTPLHGLNGTIDALTRTELGAEQRRLLDLCQASGTRLLRVIGDGASSTHEPDEPATQRRRGTVSQATDADGQVLARRPERVTDGAAQQAVAHVEAAVAARVEALATDALAVCGEEELHVRPALALGHGH